MHLIDEALAYGHYEDCSGLAHTYTAQCQCIVFTHVCQFTISILPCAQYAQRVMHLLSFCLCVCVAKTSLYTLLILPVKYISLQKRPMLLTHPLYMSPEMCC